MIPAEITRENVLAAMKRIDQEGNPPGRRARKFEVRAQGRVYPPKLVLSLACQDAIGVALDSSLFSGGSETNRFLQGLGFTVAYKRGQVLPTTRTTTTARTSKPLRMPHRDRPLKDEQESIKQRLMSGQSYTWADLEQNSMRLPKTGGIYAWFFRSIPPSVPVEGCLHHQTRTLLYLGISPESHESGGTLRNRILYHFRGNAEGSTLRRTLGCLLKEQLGTVLRRVGRGRRMTFGRQESALTRWIADNAAVAWVEVEEPWAFEADLIQSFSLPLNLEENSHPFRMELQRVRREAMATARKLPIVK